MPDARAAAGHLDLDVGSDLAVLLGPGLGHVDHGVRALVLDDGPGGLRGLLPAAAPPQADATRATARARRDSRIGVERRDSGHGGLLRVSAWLLDAYAQHGSDEVAHVAGEEA